MLDLGLFGDWSNGGGLVRGLFSSFGASGRNGSLRHNGGGGLGGLGGRLGGLRSSLGILRSRLGSLRSRLGGLGNGFVV